ncbi:hypothetical protein ACJMK2_019876 [Sinanodonta woodiana]|uniref:Uncharacterized protein n=1 Tax=Sinanodonta woodiana TaxID=1069815 RepID=A0ABD3TXN0_SINWO
MFKFCLLSALFLVTQAHWPARRGYYRPVGGIGGVLNRPNVGGGFRGLVSFGGWPRRNVGLGHFGYGGRGYAGYGLLNGVYRYNGFNLGNYGGRYLGYGGYGFGWGDDWDDRWDDRWDDWDDRWDDWDDFRYRGYGIGYNHIK